MHCRKCGSPARILYTRRPAKQPETVRRLHQCQNPECGRRFHGLEREDLEAEQQQALETVMQAIRQWPPVKAAREQRHTEEAERNLQMLAKEKCRGRMAGPGRKQARRRNCWEEAGKPWGVQEAVELIGQLYETELAGGHLHIAVDDGNLEDGCLDWCVENAGDQLLDIEREVYEALKRLTPEQRQWAWEMHWGPSCAT